MTARRMGPDHVCRTLLKYVEGSSACTGSRNGGHGGMSSSMLFRSEVAAALVRLSVDQARELSAYFKTWCDRERWLMQPGCDLTDRYDRELARIASSDTCRRALMVLGEELARRLW